MDINKAIAKELGVKESQVDNTVRLIDEGNTIPFIARYRKELTGSLNDELLRNLNERLTYLRNLEEKRKQVLASIDEQGKLTDELKTQIENAQTLLAVDDLYRPFRPRKRTRATIATERGLKPLADIILAQNNKTPISDIAAAYTDSYKEVESAEDAIAGAGDIISEQISDDANYRKYIREYTIKQGIIKSSAKDKDEKSVYEQYYEYEEAVNKIAGHRVLALNRGEREKFLSVKVKVDNEHILKYLDDHVLTGGSQDSENILVKVIEDSYSRLIAPAVERCEE